MKHKQVAVKIKTIAEYYGMENQLSKTVEELKELTEEVKTYLFDYKMQNDDITTIPLVDEIADVKIMVEQLIYLLELEEEVNNRIEFKLNRQMKRIKEEKESVQHEMF